MTDRTHYCAGCKGREDIIEKLEADITQLQVDSEPSPYCPICGSCGEEGCCGDKRCLYPDTGLTERIAELEADNARLRRDKETLLTFAQAIQTWRSDADSYDRECEQPQRNYCEDVELMEKAAGYALRRVAERAALQETSHDA